jgi:putative NIF3 family GTP cyclohydrolase 1 type 2
MIPGPDNEMTGINLAVTLAEELSDNPGMELETLVVHHPWGSEILVSYPGTWRRLWRRKRVMLLATHGGQVIALRPHGRRVRIR